MDGFPLHEGTARSPRFFNLCDGQFLTWLCDITRLTFTAPDVAPLSYLCRNQVAAPGNQGVDGLSEIKSLVSYVVMDFLADMEQSPESMVFPFQVIVDWFRPIDFGVVWNFRQGRPGRGGDKVLSDTFWCHYAFQRILALCPVGQLNSKNEKQKYFCGPREEGGLTPFKKGVFFLKPWSACARGCVGDAATNQADSWSLLNRLEWLWMCERTEYRLLPPSHWPILKLLFIEYKKYK